MDAARQATESFGAEVPEADALEQALPAAPDEDVELPGNSTELEQAAPGATAEPVTTLEADPADVAEQRRDVPLGWDEPDDRR
ncbi:MAG TPA: hypothetical protein VGD67_20220 [Pseudonocardiaceae bacterium]